MKKGKLVEERRCHRTMSKYLVRYKNEEYQRMTVRNASGLQLEVSPRYRIHSLPSESLNLGFGCNTHLLSLYVLLSSWPLRYSA